MTVDPKSDYHQVRAHTRALSNTAELVSLLPAAQQALAWVVDGEGMVGWGEAARFTVSGPNRFTKAEGCWQRYIATVDNLDEVQLPGTGPVAFISMAFANEPGESVLVVPRVLIGRRHGTTWVTTVESGRKPCEPFHRRLDPVDRPTGIRYFDGGFPADRYRRAISIAIQRMQTGELRKVVLARDLFATADATIDPRFLLRGLANRYPSCWTFAVDGLVGATPELLLRRHGTAVTSRVLAGTAWPHPGIADDRLADELLHSAKDQAEHWFAVDSLVNALRPWCASLSAPAQPHVLRLRNVMHLASEVTGELATPVSLLRLAEAVHPTAAVGGTPREQALAAIAELEEMDRGRYAGPVGWLDADGNGELGIALRCAQLSGATARMFAGGGIVAASDPDTEVTETATKMVPIRDALEGITG